MYSTVDISASMSKGVFYADRSVGPSSPLGFANSGYCDRVGRGKSGCGALQKHRPDTKMPVFTWAVTAGFTRIDKDMGSQAFSKRPEDALAQIRATQRPGLYLLLDFHPYLDDPVIVRMLKEIALNYKTLGHTVALVSHDIELPGELKVHCAEFKLALPSPQIIEDLIRHEAREWSADHGGKKVQADRESLRLLIRNLQGLTAHDARSLAHQAIYNDGAITASDLKMVMEAKYKLLDKGGVLRFDFDAAHMADVGGLKHLKKWLRIRQKAFLEGDEFSIDQRALSCSGCRGVEKVWRPKRWREPGAYPYSTLTWARSTINSLAKQRETCEKRSPQHR